MELSHDLKYRIDIYLKGHDELIRRIYKGEGSAIAEINTLATKEKITPEGIVESYENNSIEYLYRKAKYIVELKKLYHDLLQTYSSQYNHQKIKR